jgi:hypothetical protein
LQFTKSSSSIIIEEDPGALARENYVYLGMWRRGGGLCLRKQIPKYVKEGFNLNLINQGAQKCFQNYLAGGGGGDLPPSSPPPPLPGNVIGQGISLKYGKHL